MVGSPIGLFDLIETFLIMIKRAEQVNRLNAQTHDVLVIGGGINGACCAASLAVAGMKVCLVERGDFASQTSQESSNLVWGGIKYLQSGSIFLVHKLCRSRNELIRSYPSSVQEIPYFTCLQKSSPSRLLFYLGTWIYWFLGRCFTAMPRLLSLSEVREVAGGESVGGVEYSDAYLPDNDARFTFQFIRAAWRAGALAVNYAEAGKSRRLDGQWITKVYDLTTGSEHEVRSGMIINAAGPMVDEVNALNQIDTNSRIVFSKGVHLIVPRLSELDRVMTFFARDGRLFFAVPMGSCSCIGTTDTPQDDWKSEVTSEDIEFILENINLQMGLTKPLTQKDIIATRCGVRPLAVAKGASYQGDWVHLSRRHVTEVDRVNQYVSIYGGKLTDCVNVGNEARAICQGFGYRFKHGPWYGEDEGREAFLSKVASLGRDRINESEGFAPCLWRRYGRDASKILEMMKQDPELGHEVVEGSGVLWVEVRYAADHEMVEQLEDFLRRRTRLSLCNRLSEYEGVLSKIAYTLFGDQGEKKKSEYLSAEN